MNPEYEKWLRSPALSQGERAELSAISGDENEIESRFSLGLRFGTAGLRGVMGLGTNRMNIHVIRHATQGFALVILDEGREKDGAAICFDCRDQSDIFAREAACVMAANGIPVRLFQAMRPTPELSFAVRHYGCAAGINITASHNPREYNGYKAYWSDGGQLPPEHADTVAAKMACLDIFDDIKTMPYEKAVEAGLITLLGSETDEAFLSQVMAQANDPDLVKKEADSFKMAYTPFHGAGFRLIPQVLSRLGVKHLYCEPKQMVPDGSFPTVKSPNPENPEGFYLAVALAKEKGADFILGSDPDADRVGILARDESGEYRPITGNQTGALLLDYLIRAKKKRGAMPEDPVALKTIVTTELARKVAEAGGVRCLDTFTGFKYMAEMKNRLEAAGEGKVIFSYEESYGYMIGDYVRDKDAVTAALLLTEMAAWYKSRGLTLFDGLEALYKKHGYFGEKTLSLVMPGLEGMDKMGRIMDSLRREPPKAIDGTAVILRRDYLDGMEAGTGGHHRKMELSGSNVLSFDLKDRTRLLVRPSGTEPKIKLYILARGASHEDCAQATEKYSAWAETLKELG